MRERMASHGCINGTLDDTNYSSPVPVIGFYIALATLVCLLFMVSDILAGFRSRKPWLPCRLFSLNSMTLTLLSVVAKLPVDLTTPMPSAQDQLSKLTGTTLLCISMGFLMPSIEDNSKPGCLTNMIALSILVITVVVNIGMQIYTGVIFLFLTEHIIIICCMLALLLVLWFLSWGIKSPMNMSVGGNKDYLKIGYRDASMLRRLKFCYLYAYDTNHQFLKCKNPNCATIGVLCIFSFVVVTQAAFRSLVFKQMNFCNGNSDYGLSMWTIVMTQILTIVIGSIGTSIRFISLSSCIDWGQLDFEGIKGKFIEHNAILAGGIQGLCSYVVNAIVLMGIFLLCIFVLFPFVIVPTFFKLCYLVCIGAEDKEIAVVEEFKELTQGNWSLDVWTLRKSMKEMYKLMEVSKSETSNYLSELLSKTPKSHEMHGNASYLSLALLMKIAAIMRPYTSSELLLNASKEVYDIIHFIDVKITSIDYKNDEKSRLAIEVWNGSVFSDLLPKVLESSSTHGVHQPQHDANHALLMIQELRKVPSSNFAVHKEVNSLVDFISSRRCSSVEELHICITQLFVNVLHVLLARLPLVIFDEVTKSPPKEYEERVRLALILICKIAPLEALVQWSFPVESNITSLIHSQLHFPLAMMMACNNDAC